MKVLVTGGAGYIGSHTVVELLTAGHEVVVIDDLSNAKIEVIDRIKEITGKSVSFYRMDCADKEKLRDVFRNNSIDAVIHFAGFKAVGESVKKPLQYYRNNLDSTMTLLEVMEEFGCKKLVLSFTWIYMLLSCLRTKDLRKNASSHLIYTMLELHVQRKNAF